MRDLGKDASYFFKSRYYDATIGRFHIPDSVVPGAGNPQTLNRYAYALNNPLRLVDPSGHMNTADPGEGGDDQPSTDDPNSTGTYDDPTAGLFAPVTSPSTSTDGPGDSPASVQEPLGNVTTIGPSSPTGSTGNSGGEGEHSSGIDTRGIEAGSEVANGVGGLLTGNPAETFFAFTGLSGVAIENPFVLLGSAVGTYYAQSLAAAETGEGLSGIFSATGVTRAISADAGASEFFETAVPLVASTLGIAQGSLALADAGQQIASRYPSVPRLFRDALLVGSGVVGGLILLGAVGLIAVSAPEDVAALRLIGAVEGVASAAIPG
jgi:RHS repeat-associated protein